MTKRAKSRGRWRAVFALVLTARCGGDDDGGGNSGLPDAAADGLVIDATLRDRDTSTADTSNATDASNVADRSADLSVDSSNPSFDAAKGDGVGSDARDVISPDTERPDVPTDTSVEADPAADASADSDASGGGNDVVDATHGDGGIVCGAPSGTATQLGTIGMGRAVSDGSTIYFIGYPRDAIQSIPKTGGSPKTIVNTLLQAEDLALDATYVYFTRQGGVYRCPQSGCGTTPSLLAVAQPQPHRILTTGGKIFYTTETKIMSCPVDCGNVPQVFGDSGAAQSEIVTDGTNVYWTSFQADGGDYGSVLSCAVTGCAGAPTVLAVNQSRPNGLATDGEVVVWITSEDPGKPNFQGTVNSCPVGGCGGAPKRLSSAFMNGGIGRTRIESGQVIWVDGQRIYRCPTSGCDSMPTQYPVGGDSSYWKVYPAATDPTGFYWWEPPSFGAFTGPLKKCPLCGCTGTVVNAVERRGGSDVVSDGSDVFWLGAMDSSGEAIYRCAAANCAGTVQAVPSTGSAYDLHDLLKRGPHFYTFENNGYDGYYLRRWPRPSSQVVIGGTLIGLPPGASITLDQGRDNITRTADGPFTFPTPMTTAELFLVGIVTQPSGRTCRVTGGSGWVGAADVNSVVVNCALDTATVGGEVSGWLGETIVLQNNGTDSITMSADGYFAFPTPLPRGSAYNVTVSTQPAFDGACTVSAGTGTTPSGATVDVTNVAINCVRRDAGRRSNGLSADDQYLYWVQGGEVIADSGSAYSNGAAVRMPISGGSVEMLTPPLNNIGPGSSTALDSKYLYFSALDSGTIYRVLRTGGAVEPIVVGETSPTSLAIEASTLYWASATAIKSLDLANDAGGPVSIAQTPLTTVSNTSPRRLVINNRQLYWVIRTGKGDETVERTGLHGENRITLALQQTWLSGGVTLAGDKVFFTGSRPALMSVSP